MNKIADFFSSFNSKGGNVMVFDGLELKDYIVRALKDLRFEQFTDVQRAVFNKMKSQDGKVRETDTLDTEGIFRRYWSDLKRHLIDEGSQLYEKIVQLKMKVPDGKMRETDTLDTEGIFRLIESIPSPKAEPFFNIWVLSNNFHQKKE